ncbi:metallophosphoesterase [Polyangium aurulentum]|uniref:metallophosphoesterase n=1 Tax=Polyangium aurulentum TaxID=2567896 RepID=UPI001469A6F6|nr:metallophosphoesterase [Polyangium aurulentum]UQA57090.1 metallophosphoesterase [Polyangium aurulentum]
MTSRILHPTAAMISDVHVGDPENARLEDFDRDEAFAHLLDAELPARAGSRPTTLVIAGDFIDFPQILPELGKACSVERLGTTEEESLARIRRAILGHPRVFRALADFLARGNQVLVLPGNHDIDLHFPKVFGALREACGGAPAPALEFVSEGKIEQNGVYLEHGNQYSYDNWFEHWGDPIRTAPDGARRIERPWGTLFMDIVYNDIEDAYPFVNKLYPHDALARVVLRLMCDDTRISVRALARLAAFFVTRGKRAIAGWALGEEDEDGGPVTRTAIESFVDTFDSGMANDRRRALIEETAAITGASEAPEADDVLPPDIGGRIGLLGRTDERGLDRRARELLRSGKRSVVAFGHTHAPFARSVDLPGRVGWIINTGSWIPRIELGAGEAPSFAELAVAPRSHDLRYLWLQLEGSPRASLEPLTSR